MAKTMVIADAAPSLAKQVRHWFEAAVQAPAALRKVYLERHCADPAVRAEVLALLAYDEEVSAMPGVVRHAMDAVFAPGPGASGLVPRRAGVYEIGRLLGSGGMGHVYEAHRADGQVRQRVAVKFAGVAGEAAERRFQRERQMLATLRHPYIAGLIDVGRTAEGVPYAVLEQVDGVPLDEYCDEHRLDDAGRIRLVLKVSEAIQFAHRHLIVHRDLKPENVLVTADGLPKLIDFGVARDLGEDAALGQMTQAFTPGYASPEQALGQAVSVATDVYGLGALLYRLLTGEKLRTNGASLEASIRAIAEDEVTAPSAIRPSLRGDLENILRKALEREPDRRYPCVVEFAADLERFLAREPVRATPWSAWYRAHRFARRQGLRLSAAALALVSVGVVLVTNVREGERARLRAAETRRVAERLLFEIHDSIEGVPGATKAREKLGATAVEYLNRLRRDQGRDPQLTWELFNAYARLARSRAGAAFSVGDTASGVALGKQALALGAEVEAETAERKDQTFAVYAGLVNVFQEGARWREQGETIERMLRLAPALSPLRKAQAYKESGRYYEVLPAEALSASLTRPQAERRAMEDLERATAILRDVAARADAPADARPQLASTLASLGRMRSRAGDLSEAEAALREAVQVARANLAARPHDARLARHLYWSHLGLAEVYGSASRFHMERPADAAAHFAEARRVAESLLASDTRNEMAKLDLARVLGKQGAVLRGAEGFALVVRALELTRELGMKSRSALDLRVLLLTDGSRFLTQLQRLEEARDWVAEARRLTAGLPGAENTLLRAEAAWQFAAGRRDEALASVRKQLAALPDRVDPMLNENFETIEVLERLRRYAMGVDLNACTYASRRLARTWGQLRLEHPQVPLVLAREEASRGLLAGCAAR